MMDLLGIGSSGVRAYQTALEVVGGNVANANTDGYSRRGAQLGTAVTGGGWPLAQMTGGGTGVAVQQITRAYDALRSADVRVSQADLSRATARQGWLSEIETVLGSGDASLGTGLTDFFNKAQSVAADPTSLATRNLFLASAGSLAERFNAVSRDLDRVGAGIKTDAQAQVTKANGLITSLARVNENLKRAGAGTEQAASLGDERDKLLEQLAGIVGIDVSEGKGGTVEVRLGSGGGSGPILLNADGPRRLVAQGDGTSLTVLTEPGAIEVTPVVTSGSLAGAIDSQRKLNETRAGLDSLADSFAATMNNAHALGYDLNGQPGKPLFATATVSTLASPANGGTSTITASVAADATLSASGYEVRYDAPSAAWTVERQDGSLAVSGTNRITIDGMTVELGGAPTDGDRYRLTPRGGAAGISLVVKDPNEVAAADLWRSDAELTNVGTGEMTVRPGGTSALPVLTSYKVRVGAADTVDILDPADDSVLATMTATAGTWIDLPGVGFQITGLPVAGDGFIVKANSDGLTGSGAMLRLVGERYGNGLGTGFEERYDRQVSNLSSALADTSALTAATQVVRDQAVVARDERSAVSLDTEAADLIRLQQAYQASAKVIATARQLFDTIIDLA